jgi:hypothetical protein
MNRRRKVVTAAAFSLLNLLLVLSYANPCFGGGKPISIVYNDATKKNEIRTVDPATGVSSLLTEVAFDDGFWRFGTFTVDTKAKRIYVMSSSNTLYVFDSTTGQPLPTQQVTLPLQALQATGDGGLIGIWYNDNADEDKKNAIYRVDPTTGASTRLKSFRFDSKFWRLGTFSVNTTAKRLWIMSSANTLYELDANTGQIVSIVSVDQSFQSLAIADPPRLFVVIPGINDHGLMMLFRAEELFRFDVETSMQICDSSESQMCLRPDRFRCLNGRSDPEIRQAIREASRKAVEKGRDVIVNIDMDLEDYLWEFPLPPFTNRWTRSVRWAGKMANIVSDSFTREVREGIRMLYAHSAGGDAAFQSIYQMPRKEMFDDFNILNGRTSANNLRNAINRSRYRWCKIKVFTNNGDLPATLPLFLLGSIANFDVAKKYAGMAWVHLHSCDLTGHNGMRDAVDIPGAFQVNLKRASGFPNCDKTDTVDNLMLQDWTK